MNVKQKLLVTAVFVLILYVIALLLAHRFWSTKTISHKWILIHPPGHTQTLMTVTMPGTEDEIWEIVGKHNHSGLLQLRDVEGHKRAEYSVSNGMRHGRVILWSRDGQRIMESSYASNQLNGAYTTWSTDGSLSHKGAYVDGKPTGRHISWYRKGAMARKQFRTNGLLHGPSQIWDRSGRLIEDALYEMGKPTSGRIITEWDGEGEPTVIDVVESDDRAEGETERSESNISIIATESDSYTSGAPD